MAGAKSKPFKGTVISAMTLYNNSHGHDKEYHIQVIEIDEPTTKGQIFYGVNYQFGKRGTKLQHFGMMPYTLGRMGAMSLARAKFNEKRSQRGYEEVHLEAPAVEVYQKMVEGGLHAIGVDLFIRLGNKEQPFRDYLNLQNSPSLLGAAQISNAYKAHSVVSAIAGVEAEEQKHYLSLSAELQRLVSRSDLGIFDVFLGFENDGRIYKGVPPRNLWPAPKADRPASEYRGYNRTSL